MTEKQLEAQERETTRIAGEMALAATEMEKLQCD